MAEFTPFAGLTALTPNDPWSTDGYSFQSRNPKLIDRLLEIGVVTHRHDAHPALADPIEAASATAFDTGGALPADLTLYIGYTLVDFDGGETLISPAAVATTAPPIEPPSVSPTAVIDYVAGELLTDTYYYALTYFDGEGGETALGPYAAVEREPGYEFGQVFLTGLDDGMVAAGAVGWRLYRAIGGSQFHLLAVGTGDSFTDNGSTGVNCDVMPPSGNRANGANRIDVELPAMPSAGVELVRLYASPDGGFPSPALIRTIAVADAGIVQEITAMAADIGRPPDVSMSKPGASKIDPDTDILDWHWKRPVATEDDLPTSGNEAGDVRMTLDTLGLWAWDEEDGSWASTGGGGGGGGGMSFKGEWSDVASYRKGDVVEADDNRLYIAGSATTSEPGGGNTVLIPPGSYLAEYGPFVTAKALEAGGAILDGDGSTDEIFFFDMSDDADVTFGDWATEVGTLDVYDSAGEYVEGYPGGDYPDPWTLPDLVAGRYFLRVYTYSPPPVPGEPVFTVTPSAGELADFSNAWSLLPWPNATVADESVLQTQQPILDFRGPGVTVTDDPASSATVVTITGGSGGVGGSGHVIEEESSPLTARAKLDFRGPTVTVTDDAGGNRTIVTVASGVAQRGHTVLDETTARPQRTELAFQGPTVAVTDDPTNDRTLVTVSSGVAQRGHTILDETTARPQRSELSFQGTSVTVTDDPANDRTVVAVASAGSGAGGHTIKDEGSALTARAGLNFIGAGVTATDDAAGNETEVYIPGVSSGASLDRHDVIKTTASLATAAEETGTISMPKGSRLLRIQTSRAARVRLYGTAAARTADSARAVGTDPTGDHGVMLDFVTTGADLDWSMAPPVDVANLDVPAADTIYYAITNDGSVGTVQVTLTYIPTEVSTLHSNSNGQAGIVGPSGAGLGLHTTTNAVTANLAKFARIRPDRDITVSAIKFLVTTAAGSDDACDVAIYSADLATKHVSAGATSGKLNSTGVKSVAITPYKLLAGTVYYLAFSCGAVGGTAAQLLMTAGTTGMAALFGATPGLFERAGLTASHPLPASPTTATDTTNVPVLIAAE